jgi:hypothetical protein
MAWRASSPGLGMEALAAGVVIGSADIALEWLFTI